MAERKTRVAAIGDLHFDPRSRGSLSELFDRVNREADILALVGDLTTHGRRDQMEAFIEELRVVDVPVVTVLGNHDHEEDNAEELSGLLAEAGIVVLDGNAVEIEGVGFTGVKGFAGGFGRAALGPFGEPLIKQFVTAAVDESLKLERGLRELKTDHRIVLLHYAPIPDTLAGEPEQIYTFLGSSRLLQPIETLKPDVVFHGHAHHGTYRGETPSGIPVFNVALHVLQAEGLAVHMHEAAAPERRRRTESRAEGDDENGGRGGAEETGATRDGRKRRMEQPSRATR
ncbi:MAG: metallophosphoesterase [Gemmatimonadetes bacterium]|nr:metallophosphoesterase [Gemmatimonadota bacterium]